jgi:hypothetical protein
MVPPPSRNNYFRLGVFTTVSPRGTGFAPQSAGMNQETNEETSGPRDEDLARWAKELGVSYEELRSTLNYAGPTFKDLTLSSDARRAGSTSIPS